MLGLGETNSLTLDAIHLAGVALGLWILTRPVRSRMLRWALTAACCAPMALFLLDVSEPGAPFSDFTSAYWTAGRAVLAGPAGVKALFETGVEGFVNLPIVALLFAPFGLLPVSIAKWAFFLLGVGSVLYVWTWLRRRYGYDGRESALALFALASFGPLIYSLREGNTSHILLAVVLAGMSLASARKDAAAGALFGVCALLKPPLLLLGVYALARGRFRIVAGGAAVCAGAALLSLLVFGWDTHRLWLEQLRTYGAQPLAAYNSQSFASAAARLQHGYAAIYDWSPQTLARPLGAAVAALTLISAALGLRAALAWRQGASRSDASEDYGIILVLTFVCLASTVSWTHYYVWLIPAFAYLAARAPRGGRNGGALGLAAALSAPALIRSPAMAEGAYEPFTWLLSSHLLAGGLVVFALLCAYPPAPAGEAAASDSRATPRAPGRKVLEAVLRAAGVRWRG